ncbi:MAG TPA: histidine kinase [Burkholderiaceae bacterium]
MNSTISANRTPDRQEGVSQTPTGNLADIPFWMAIVAGLPISLCMAVMSAPELAHGWSAAFRALYLAAFVAWIFPLAWLQRTLWRAGLRWWNVASILLTVTYGMSLINAALGMSMAVKLQVLQDIEWTNIFRGLDGCWLALIGFCALHTVVAYYAALSRAQSRIVEALALARDAQLSALRYQVHPHFLFNTLNAISALVASGRNREANRMITQLGDFLRATIDREGCHEHALADEIALTEGYIEIEKARLGEKLKISIQVGPEVLGAFVPYMVLQPLVENAIRHGIALRSEVGNLNLQIARQGERLTILLENDGISPQPINEETGHTTGIGLKNVGERLATLYGTDHEFAATQDRSGNYQVRISLPLREVAAAVPIGWVEAA